MFPQMTPTYTSKDVCRMTGCTHRQLQYWEQKGYLHPQLGSRNVRFYDDDAIRFIEKIIQNKKSGKSLGEAYVISDKTIVNTGSLQPHLISQIEQLEAEWFGKNDALLQRLEQIYKLESTIPRYPYFVYNESDLEKLKSLQTEAKALKQRKDILFHDIRSQLLGMTPPPSPKPATTIETTTPLPTHHYSVDQLVLLWIKKNGLTNTLEIREKIQTRLRFGESIDQLVKELA